MQIQVVLRYNISLNSFINIFKSKRPHLVYNYYFPSLKGI